MGIRPSRYEDENVQENFFLKEHRILPLPPLSPLLSQRIRSMSATGTKVDATMDLLSYFSVGQLDLPDGSNARGFEHLVAHLPGSDKLAEDLSENTKLTPLILAAPDGPPLHWTPDDIDLMQFEQALMLDVTSAPLGLVIGEFNRSLESDLS